MGKKATVFLSLVVVCLLTSSLTFADNSQPAPVRFAILGDRTGGHVRGVYEGIVAEVARMCPDFVLNVGDMIEGYIDDSAQIETEWDEYDAILKPLHCPVYRTPGNHDIWSDLAERIFGRRCGAPFRSFDLAGIHFIVLDVSRWEKASELPSAELTWLADDLQAHVQAAHTLIFYHKPFWYDDIARSRPDTLHALFVKYGVDAVFTGHFHEYFHGVYDKIGYTSVGSSGGATEPAPTGLEYHFTWVTVDSSGIHVAPIEAGSVLPVDHITAAERMQYTALQNQGLRVRTAVPVASDLTAGPAKVELELNFASTELPLDDTLCWTVPPGWKVEPPALPVNLPEGSWANFVFIAGCSGSLYPLPAVSVRLPYAEGKTVDIHKPLRIARFADCLPTKLAPKLDGRLTEACWSSPVTLFFDDDGGVRPTEPFEVSFAYDSVNLYLGATCTESKMDSLVAKIKEHDGTIFGEDCLGFFLQPANQKDTAYQIYFNPLGTVFDQVLCPGASGEWVGERSWNGDYQVKTARGKNGWSLEARIPVRQFGAKLGQGEDWRLNFRRKQRRLNTAADWQAPIDYDPGTFGILKMR